MLSNAEGHPTKALSEMRDAAEMEDKTQLASVTPGPLTPAREMLGELLLEAKRPSEALKQFEASLRNEPNRFWSLYGAAEAAKHAGDRRTSTAYFQQLLSVAKHADGQGRKELAEARSAVERN